MSDDITVLCVCTFNRTRSVMMAALLQRHLADLGVAARVASAGTRADGGAPTRETVKLLAQYGIDVNGHQGAPLDQHIVESADLIVTAEQQHVVDVAGHWPDALASTFTLAELVERAQVCGGRLGAPIDEWRALLNEGRPTGIDYLDDRTIGEIADPTGLDSRAWNVTFAQIDDLTRRLAVAIG